MSADRQSQYHKAAGIDSGLFKGQADISLFANDCLKGARSPEALGNPRLHYGVHIRQAAPVPLDTSLEVRAEVTAVEPLRRGRLIRIGFSFVGADGLTPLEIEHQSLILDPDPVGTDPAPAVDWNWQDADVIRDVPMSLPAVSGFSWEFPYLEGHHTQEGADKVNMRVPIAQGVMGFTLLWAEAVRAMGGPPTTCAVSAEFRRPIFCDETVRLIGRRSTGGAWEALGVLNPAGKPTTQVRVEV